MHCSDNSQAVARDAVLYVEDNPLNVMLMQSAFELRPDLQLHVAIDGKSAVSLATQLRPALLLLDLNLPDCHGLDLLAQLRTVPGWEAIPAIALTAEPEVGVSQTSLEAVWHKPLRIPTLLTRLDRILKPPRHGWDDGDASPFLHRK